MKINFPLNNAYIFKPGRTPSPRANKQEHLNGVSKSRLAADTAAFTKNASVSFGNKRVLAGTLAALMLASSAAPALSVIRNKEIETAREETLQINVRMQKVTQRIFEIYEKTAKTEAELDEIYELESQNFDAQSQLYDMLDLAKTEEEKAQIREKLFDASEEQFDLANQFALASSEQSILESTETCLYEEMYRLHGNKTGQRNVSMPITKAHYAYDDPEYEQAIDESNKNVLYCEFRDNALSECKDDTEAGITLRIIQLSQQADSLRPAADTYLAGVEADRKEALANVEKIIAVLDEIKQLKQNGAKDDAVKALEEELKALQADRDKRAKSRNEFEEEHFGAYKEYINLVLKITVLEDYLLENS